MKIWGKWKRIEVLVWDMSRACHQLMEGCSIRENPYWIGANPLIPSICTSIYSSPSTFKPLSHLIFTNASKNTGHGLIILMYKNGHMVWPRSQNKKE